MPFTLYALMEAAVLASSLSLDAFTVGFAYGSKKIKIPFLSVCVINIICSTVTGLAFFAGRSMAHYIPKWIAVSAAFGVLFVIGMIKLLDSITKSIIRKHSSINKQFKISMFNFKFILSLYANPEDADIDESKTISPSEAAALAASLSLDGMAIGFGAAFVDVNGLAVFVCSLLTNAASVVFGHRLGKEISEKMSFNLSWISGAVLIALAFSKL